MWWSLYFVTSMWHRSGDHLVSISDRFIPGLFLVNIGTRKFLPGTKPKRPIQRVSSWQAAQFAFIVSVPAVVSAAQFHQS